MRTLFVSFITRSWRTLVAITKFFFLPHVFSDDEDESTWRVIAKSMLYVFAAVLMPSIALVTTGILSTPHAVYIVTTMFITLALLNRRLPGTRTVVVYERLWTEERGDGAVLLCTEREEGRLFSTGRLMWYQLNNMLGLMVGGYVVADLLLGLMPDQPALTQAASIALGASINIMPWIMIGALMIFFAKSVASLLRRPAQ